MKVDLLALMARTGGGLAAGKKGTKADPLFDAIAAALGVTVPSAPVQAEPAATPVTVGVHAAPPATVPRDHAGVVAPGAPQPPSVHDHVEPAPVATAPTTAAAPVTPRTELPVPAATTTQPVAPRTDLPVARATPELPATAAPTLPLAVPVQVTAPAVVRAPVAPTKPRVADDAAPVVPTTAAPPPAPATAAPTEAPAVTTALPQLPATIVQQVTHLVHRGPTGEHTVTVHLHPAELGAVEVTVTVTRDATHVHLAAAHPDAAAAVQQALPQLSSGLADAGLPQVDVQLGDRSTPQPQPLPQPFLPRTEHREQRDQPQQRTTDPRRLLDVAL